tara:strand:+ start:212 stop:712 length:501 start_codon:yes stop_codon:yes gene_type:complete
MANKPPKPNRGYKSTTADIVYTQESSAKEIVEYFKPTGLVLEPCMGAGVFYNLFDEPKEWCEIDKGRDFFEWTQPVDWIITNPPYSIYDLFLEHCLEVADNVVLFVPLIKVFKSVKIDKMISKYGGLKEIVHMGSGGKHGFPFGFPTGCVYYQRGYKGPITYTTKY